MEVRHDPMIRFHLIEDRLRAFVVAFAEIEKAGSGQRAGREFRAVDACPGSIADVVLDRVTAVELRV